MAQFNITLNQEEILQLLLNNSEDAFRKLLEASLNAMLKVESEEQLKAKPYERSEERTDSRNGFRDRSLNTRIGTITLHVPRHRNIPFKTMIFESYSRSEAALIATMAEMVVCVVSTRKIAKVMEELCGTSYSKSAVSELCKSLDAEVEKFRNRPLTGSYPFVTLDATYFKDRENHKVISKAFMIALGTNSDGKREILGFDAYPRESIDTWRDFLRGLKARGLKDVLMITSDAHEGIRHAVSEEFPEASWQRCQAHFKRNICNKAPAKYQAGLSSELQEMFNARDIKTARKKRDSIIADYSDVAESAMKCLDEGFESCMTAIELPDNLYQQYRTSNHIERLNRELKRRSNVIGIFPNEASLIRLMGSVLMELNEGYQNGRRVFSIQVYQQLISSRIPVRMKTIAEEQRQLLAA